MPVEDHTTVGIDLERVDSIPEAGDYREDEFCKNIFTPREIAYALLQPSPRQSLAAMWCAKEAFRKAVPAYLGSDWNRTVVSHANQGKPYIVVDGKTAPGTLSLTHAGDLALAVFVAAPAPVAPQPLVDELRTQTPGAPPKSGRYAQAIAVLALIFSLFASLFCILR
jgi:holo-[acyl-carrier protein] synthase